MDIERDIIINSYYVISYFKQKKVSVTNLKLQKLMYFMEGIYIAISDEDNLFNQDFLAWNLGPVCRELYDKYKSNGNDEIELNDEQLKEVKKIPEINDILVKILFKFFGSWSAYELVELTHIEGSPWYNVTNGNDSEEDIIIPKCETRNWIKGILKLNDNEE